MAELKRLKITLARKLHCPYMLALKTFPTEKFTQSNSWEALYGAILYHRNRPFYWHSDAWVNTSSGPVAWLERTPGLLEWVKSDACLVSPLEWPQSVLPAFRHRLIPTPHEFANVDMNRKYARTERAFRQHLTLLLYCMGVPISMTAKAYDTSEREIERMMYMGIENIQEVPQYMLWATATDFRKAVFPAFVTRIPMRTRMKFLAALQSNPFLADHTFSVKLVQSAPYYSYLIYGSPKRMRLTKGCRIYRTGEKNGS